MADGVRLPGYRWFRAFKNAPIRLGVYIGVCLSVVFTAWLILANRVAFLEPFALERNAAAAAVLILLALIPVLRFFRSPWGLLLSGLVCWVVFSFVYRILCLFFSALEDWHTALQVLMLGVVVYLIATTLSWLGTLFWHVRNGGAAHFRNHVS
jgi:hypothetical protein